MQTNRVIKSIVELRDTLDVNFDIFEFALMRYIIQLNTMFIDAKPK